MNANTEETTQNSFVLALGALRKGKTMDECSVKLAELIESVRKTGKKGSFKLTLTIEPSKDAERGLGPDRGAPINPLNLKAIDNERSTDKI